MKSTESDENFVKIPKLVGVCMYGSILPPLHLRLDLYSEATQDTFVFSERHEFSSPDALPAGHETIISALPCDDDAGEFTPLLQVADPPFGSPESPRSPASTGSLRRRRRRASDSPASPASPASVSGAFKTTPSEGEPVSSTEHWVTVLPGAAQ